MARHQTVPCLGCCSARVLGNPCQRAGEYLDLATGRHLCSGHVPTDCLEVLRFILPGKQEPPRREKCTAFLLDLMKSQKNRAKAEEAVVAAGYTRAEVQKSWADLVDAYEVIKDGPKWRLTLQTEKARKRSGQGAAV